MADARARIEAQDQLTGEWVLIGIAPDYETAGAITRALLRFGLDTTISCGCGSYEYGGCALCKDPDTEPSHTIDNVTVLCRPAPVNKLALILHKLGLRRM